MDIMDGHYVPNLSFSFPVIRTIRFLSKLPLDVHLMVTNPDFHISLLLDMDVQWVSFHRETFYHSHPAYSDLKRKRDQNRAGIKSQGLLGTLRALLPDLDYILVMSVNPGFRRGIPSAIYKIWDLFNLRKKNNTVI